MPGPGFTLLVGPHSRQSRFVRGGVARIGICAAIPPIACAPRLWQVWISNSE
jgi:hypothetical protein